MEEDSSNSKNENKFTTEQLRGWEEYRTSLLKQKVKSDDLFEKAITFISSGALALSITFHDKIVPVENVICPILIAVGWFFLIITLFLNLYSHYKSSKSTDSSINEINQVITYKMKYEEYDKKLEKRNTVINKLNEGTIWSLGLGLLFLVVYITINIHHGKEEPTANQAATTQTKGKVQTERADGSTSIFIIKQ